MAKDLYHDLVKQALINDGWTITSAPYRLDWIPKWQIDLGAEKIISAEKENHQIAVEIKTFLKPSFSHEFHAVLGQYLSYLFALNHTDKNRVLYLAVPVDIWETEFQEEGILLIIKKYNVKFIIYDVKTKKINQWII